MSDTFDYKAWLEAQDEATRNGITAHWEKETSGLKSALQSEREAKRGFEDKIKELTPKAEKGSDLESKLTQIQADLETERTKASFFQGGSSAGVKNLDLAWVAAQSGKHFKSDGTPDFDVMKAKYPELFGSTNPPGDAPPGGAPPAATKDFNSIMREAAGFSST